MVESTRFRFRSLDELQNAIEQLGLELPTTEDFTILGTPVCFGKKNVPNRLACHPMEGCDGAANGAPSELTRRRYRRFAAGGAGLIWMEACAVTRESRANPRQLWLHEEVLPDYKDLVKITREAAWESMQQVPFLVLQLTHSGRYSRPGKKPQPIIAHHSAVLDPKHRLPPDYPLITDEELEKLQNNYVTAAHLAQEAGFDAVDIKSCHRYLINELLASFTRENSRFGGSYENRVRMLLDIVTKIRKAIPDLEVTSRLNVYDAIEYPYGWGVDSDDYQKPDLSEPLKLIGRLRDLGYHGINISIANPYFNPHYGRPYDNPVHGGYGSPEPPLVGVARLIRMARIVQEEYRDLTVVSTGYSWLRRFVPYVAAAVLQKNWCAVVGLGRGAFAYPDFAKDILQKGTMEGLKTCVACSSCTQIMRNDGRTGCVVRDAEIYSPIYKEGLNRDPVVMRKLAAQCRGCTDPTCVAHCPAGVDIPGFLGAVAEGNEKAAYRILRRANLLPEICGWVCPTEVQCQGHCIERTMDQSIPIARIQRYVAECARIEGWTALAIPAAANGKKVAIIGAGPAGLSCAAGLLELGYEVVILDRGGKPGGKAISVIPRNRLPWDDAEAEIRGIFDEIGPDRLEWRWRTALGPDYTLADVQQEGFDAIVLAFGLGNSISLNREQSKPEGVIDALAFLEHMNHNPGHAVPEKVAVLGGGNTAVDAAVTAKNRGAEDVYLVYRRSFQQMPAWPEERKNILDQGIHLLLLTQPVGYEADSEGRLYAIRVMHTELEIPDASGRRRPKAVAGTEHIIRVSLAVEAMGETLSPEVQKVLHPIQLTAKGLVQADRDTFMTSKPGIFAAGDLINGGTTVVQAIAEGREAAKQVHQYLQPREPLQIIS